MAVIQATGGGVRLLAATTDNESFTQWSPDSKSLIIERRSADVRDRTLLLASIDGAAPKVLYRQHEEKFLQTHDKFALFSPDGQTIAFTSDADGWNQIYLAGVKSGTIRQLTSGHFEVSFLNWDPSGSGLVFCSTEPGTEQRHIIRYRLIQELVAGSPKLLASTRMPCCRAPEARSYILGPTRLICRISGSALCRRAPRRAGLPMR